MLGDIKFPNILLVHDMNKYCLCTNNDKLSLHTSCDVGRILRVNIHNCDNCGTVQSHRVTTVFVSRPYTSSVKYIKMINIK